MCVTFLPLFKTPSRRVTGHFHLPLSDMRYQNFLQAGRRLYAFCLELLVLYTCCPSSIRFNIHAKYVSFRAGLFHWSCQCSKLSSNSKRRKVTDVWTHRTINRILLFCVDGCNNFWRFYQTIVKSAY